MPLQRTPRPHWLALIDPRLKILLAGCFGVLAWHLSPTALGIVGICLWILCLRAEFFSRAHWPMLRSYGLFVLFWGLLKFGLDATALLHSPPPHAPLLQQAAADAGLLAGRLGILIALGLILALSSSPRQLGLALSWFLRPLLGRNSWKTALSLALMIHFLPLAQRTLMQVREAMRLRRPKRSRWQCFLLVPQAVLRILAQKTWTQTVAVAARGLDNPEAWVPGFPPQPLVWAGGSLVAGLGLALLYL